MRKLRVPNHGSPSEYSNHRCRCDLCKAAWAEACRRRERTRESRATPEHVHGTVNGYGNYGCRCRPCTDSWTLADRLRRQKRRLLDAQPLAGVE